MASDLVSKTAFAALLRVHASRVSQYISQSKIYGDAIVGVGRHARIRVSVATEQLKKSLDVDQRIGANGRARLDDLSPPPAIPEAAPPTIEDKLKKERLEGLELANERAREERSARAGLYVKSDDVRREMGRVGSHLMSSFDSALTEFATAIAANTNMTTRDAGHLLRTTWRSIRERNSEHEAERAAALPPLVVDCEAEAIDREAEATEIGEQPDEVAA
jgi:hypothetical protein